MVSRRDVSVPADDAGPASSAGRRRLPLWRRWADNDDLRTTVATLFGFVIAVPLMLALVMVGHLTVRPGDQSSLADYTLVSMAVFWCLFGVLYLVFTLRRFGRVDHRTLYRDLRTVSPGKHSKSTSLVTVSSTMNWTVQLTITSLLLVVAIMLRPDLSANLSVRILCVVMVGVSWGVLVVTQALAYARTYASRARSGVSFPGTPEPTFEDFVTLAVCISAMLGPADARLYGRPARRILRNHVLVSFGFNSMVIAALASLMLRS